MFGVCTFPNYGVYPLFYFGSFWHVGTTVCHLNSSNTFCSHYLKIPLPEKEMGDFKIHFWYRTRHMLTFQIAITFNKITDNYTQLPLPHFLTKWTLQLANYILIILGWRCKLKESLQMSSICEVIRLLCEVLVSVNVNKPQKLEYFGSEKSKQTGGLPAPLALPSLL